MCKYFGYSTTAYQPCGFEQIAQPLCASVSLLNRRRIRVVYRDIWSSRRLSGKSTCDAVDAGNAGLIPELGGEQGPLQNPMERRSHHGAPTVTHRSRQELDMTEATEHTRMQGDIYRYLPTTYFVLGCSRLWP